MLYQTDTDSIGFLITDVARLIRSEMDRRTSDAGLGLTAGEGRILVHAARAGAIRQNVLAERMGLEAMTLSGYLDRLEAQGFIERRPDPTDRRAKLVHLTDAADCVLTRIMPISAGLRADAARDIDPGDWTRLHDMLRTIRANLSAVKSDCARKQGVAT